MYNCNAMISFGGVVTEVAGESKDIYIAYVFGKRQTQTSAFYVTWPCGPVCSLLFKF